MESIFDKTARDKLVKRINSLNENSKAQWGKMNVSQMMQHCTKWEEMALGKKKYKQSFIGRLFGKMALKDMMKDEPMKKDLPTVPSFRVTEIVMSLKKKRNGSVYLTNMIAFQMMDLFTLFLGQ